MVSSFDIGDQFLENVALELEMAQHTVSGMCLFVVPTLAVNSIGTENLQVAAVDLCRQYVDHTPVLILKKLAHRSRKDNDRGTCVPENKQFGLPLHFPAKSLMRF